MTSSLPNLTISSGIQFLGEIVSWEFPAGTKFQHSDLVAALAACGLNAAAARSLHPRFAFIRAIRQMAADKIIGSIEDGTSKVTFQLTHERLDQAANLLAYDFEATVSMCKVTGTIMSTDPVLEAEATRLMNHHLGRRKIQDVTRLLQGLFGKNADLFPIKQISGVYFVPQRFSRFLDQIDLFVTKIGGQLRRYPIPEGTPQGNASVAAAVSDGLADMISEYEETVRGLQSDASEKAVNKAWDSVATAYQKVSSYRDYLGAHCTILEDHVALVGHLIRKLEDEKAAAQAGQLAVAV